MTDELSRYKKLGPLQDLLLEACPPDDRGKRSIPALAKALGISHQYIYRWIKTGVLPQHFVPELVKLSNGTIPPERFVPFLF